MVVVERTKHAKALTVRRRIAKSPIRHRQESEPSGETGTGVSPRRWVLLALAVCTALGSVFVGALTFWPDRGASAQPRAIIVDQLARTFPNPALVSDTTELLRKAGYAVDYVPDDQVTVDFYRNLPEKQYAMILLRSHVARRKVDGVWSDATLFTSESPVFEAHAREYKQKLLGVVTNDQEPGIRYAGVRASFIEHEMVGDLHKATVVLMGCDGLRDEVLARAFVARGAAEFVSWNESVTPGHNDAATTRLLAHLVADGHTAGAAVAETMADVGSDPAFGAQLLAYP